ncbi:unnamed protein product [Heligmosomoides polygyrus]|uniref:Uncharacterized protein n=1 Tax=Heligmosomoides polygyrus TaxID=6339 RepID=A0A3P8EFM4_HELPZ|nr:unnamed protein product [Heligmosomoides polygyrus]
MGLSDGGGSLRSRITRSLGRRFGGQVVRRILISEADSNSELLSVPLSTKTSLSTMESQSGVRGDSAIGGTHFNMLARAYLVLTDAGDECKIHDLKMSAFGEFLVQTSVQIHLLTTQNVMHPFRKESAPGMSG